MNVADASPDTVQQRSCSRFRVPDLSSGTKESVDASPRSLTSVARCDETPQLRRTSRYGQGKLQPEAGVSSLNEQMTSRPRRTADHASRPGNERTSVDPSNDDSKDPWLLRSRDAADHHALTHIVRDPALLSEEGTLEGRKTGPRRGRCRSNVAFVASSLSVTG